MEKNCQCRKKRAGALGFIIVLLFIYLVAAEDSNARNSKKRIQPLVSGPSQTGKYDTVDFSLEFQYTYQPESGQESVMEFNASLKRKRQLDSLDIWINFLDENGKRLKRVRVFGSGAGRGVANRSFEVKFNVPPGASQFEFTSISQEKRDIF